MSFVLPILPSTRLAKPPLPRIALAALAIGAVVLPSVPASAQYWAYPPGRVAVAGPWAGGYYGPRYGWGGGYYRPAYYGGYYRGYYPYRPYRGGGGGALAAGLIGGLALGAIASAAANPYYASPYYYPQPAYYRRPYYAAPYYAAPAYRTVTYAPARSCFFERRQVVNRYGRVVLRRVQVCY